MKFLPDFLKKNNHLQKINLSSNNIGDEGMKYLSESLKINSILNSLNLDNNKIGPEYLSESFHINSSFSIYHNENKLGNQGMSYLSDCLKKKSSINEISLYNNKIGDEGANYILDSLSFNDSLVIINLNSNKITENINHFINLFVKENNYEPESATKRVQENLENYRDVKQIKLYFFE